MLFFYFIFTTLIALRSTVHFQHSDERRLRVEGGVLLRRGRIPRGTWDWFISVVTRQLFLLHVEHQKGLKEGAMWQEVERQVENHFKGTPHE